MQITNDTSSTKNKQLAKSVLHDIIKSVINYYPLQVMEICRHSPIKRSRLLSNSHWHFVESRQEQINVKHRQADAVWFFEDNDKNNYFVVHEVKTGLFDVEEIHRKYHTGMNVQIWIWAFKHNIPDGKLPVTIKIIPIDYIAQYVFDIAEQSLLHLKQEGFEHGEGT